VWFQKAMARSSRYASTYIGMAQALERSGRRAEAARYYEMYLESFPVGSQAARARQALERLR
jgi:predicted TPR repeat methyltransferase